MRLSDDELGALLRKPGYGVNGQGTGGGGLARGPDSPRPRQEPPPPRAPSKFGNVPTDGYASGREAERAAQLRLLAKAGVISELREQVPFEIIPRQDGMRACFYIADFVYRDSGGALVVEDTKGLRTEIYRIKRKLMLFVHGIRILET